LLTESFPVIGVSKGISFALALARVLAIKSAETIHKKIGSGISIFPLKVNPWDPSLRL
jgi:hypothetical protein